MWAAAGFDGADAWCGKRVVSVEEVGVFAREDVVGHGGEAVAVTEGKEEREKESGFATTDGAVGMVVGLAMLEQLLWSLLLRNSIRHH